MFTPQLLEIIKKDCGTPVGIRMHQDFYLPPKSFKETFNNDSFEIREELKPLFIHLNETLNKKYHGLEGKPPFPNCCHEHRNLAKLDSFRPEHFTEVAYWTAQKAFFTIDFIFNNLTKDDFKVNFRDFLDNVVRSFGSIPKGYGEPYLLSSFIDYLKYFIENQTQGLTIKGKEFIYSEIFNATNPPNININEFKILVEKYHEWLKIFPFQIPFMKDYKKYYEVSVITNIIKQERTNKYGSYKVIYPHNQESLLQSLNTITLDLLGKIKVNDLKNKWSISEFQENQQAIDDKKLELDVMEITRQHSKGKLQYVKALKKWLKLHAKYFINLEKRFEGLELIEKNKRENLVKRIQPTPPSEKKTRLLNSIESLTFFKIYIVNETGKEFNNDGILTIDNWNSLKDIFFKQRIENYKSSYTFNEKIELELDTLDSLIIKELDYKILKGRYKKLLTEISISESTIKDNSTTTIQNKKIKYSANENALAYIFDLYANGEQVPINRVEGSLNAKKLKEIGSKRGFSKPDTFYRSVKNVLKKFDLNNKKDLDSISIDWYNAVKNLSKDWVTMKQYLDKKELNED